MCDCNKFARGKYFTYINSFHIKIEVFPRCLHAKEVIPMSFVLIFSEAMCERNI